MINSLTILFQGSVLALYEKNLRLQDIINKNISQIMNILQDFTVDIDQLQDRVTENDIKIQNNTNGLSTVEQKSNENSGNISNLEEEIGQLQNKSTETDKRVSADEIKILDNAIGLSTVNSDLERIEKKLVCKFYKL